MTMLEQLGIDGWFVWDDDMGFEQLNGVYEMDSIEYAKVVKARTYMDRTDMDRTCGSLCFDWTEIDGEKE